MIPMRRSVIRDCPSVRRGSGLRPSRRGGLWPHPPHVRVPPHPPSPSHPEGGGGAPLLIEAGRSFRGSPRTPRPPPTLRGEGAPRSRSRPDAHFAGPPAPPAPLPPSGGRGRGALQRVGCLIRSAP